MPYNTNMKIVIIFLGIAIIYSILKNVSINSILSPCFLPVQDDSQSSTSGSEADSIEPETSEVKISEEQIKKLLATPRPDTPPKKRRRRMPHNGTDAVDSEKDSEAGSVKGSSRKQSKTPSRRLHSRTPKGRPKVIIVHY